MYEVANTVATCFFTVVLFISLLHDLDWELQHECIALKHTVQMVLMEESRNTLRGFLWYFTHELIGISIVVMGICLSASITNNPCFLFKLYIKL